MHRDEKKHRSGMGVMLRKFSVFRKYAGDLRGSQTVKYDGQEESL
jgi:hypothetical protein